MRASEEVPEEGIRSGQSLEPNATKRVNQGMKKFLRDNGLSLALVGSFLALFLGGQLFCGWNVHNEDLRNHGVADLSLGQYLHSAHFLEATSENWESEFLEMFVYVTITVFLYQRGSAESNDPDKKKPARSVTAKSPWPVRKGGWWRKIYARSLSLSFLLLFLIAFAMHANGSTRLENEERAWRGEAPQSLIEHIKGPEFWFQSFQNWQSEFLAISSMVVLSIFLREKDSPESKPVEAPHAETGG